MTISEMVQKYQTSHSDIEDGSREQFLIGKAYYDGFIDHIDKTIKIMVELGLFGCEDSVYAERYKKEMMEE